MSNTSELISKICITFNDGSVIELVDKIRFNRIKDGLKTASIVNNQLNEQMKLLEEKISELQSQLNKFNKEEQEMIEATWVNIYAYQENQFKNPLP